MCVITGQSDSQREYHSRPLRTRCLAVTTTGDQCRVTGWNRITNQPCIIELQACYDPAGKQDDEDQRHLGSALMSDRMHKHLLRSVSAQNMVQVAQNFVVLFRVFLVWRDKIIVRDPYAGQGDVNILFSVTVLEAPTHSLRELMLLRKLPGRLQLDIIFQLAEYLNFLSKGIWSSAGQQFLEAHGVFTLDEIMIFEETTKGMVVKLPIGKIAVRHGINPDRERLIDTFRLNDVLHIGGIALAVP